MCEPAPDSDEEIEEDEDVKVTDVEGLLSSVTKSEGQPPHPNKLQICLKKYNQEVFCTPE